MGVHDACIRKCMCTFISIVNHTNMLTRTMISTLMCVNRRTHTDIEADTPQMEVGMKLACMCKDIGQYVRVLREITPARLRMDGNDPKVRAQLHPG